MTKDRDIDVSHDLASFVSELRRLADALDRVRRKLAAAQDGDRQMVDILTTVLSDGLPAVEAATPPPLRVPASR